VNSIEKNTEEKALENFEAYFNDIRNKIINVLHNAKSSIKIAMCYFTNAEIASAILEKKNFEKEKCLIQILISDNPINRNCSKFDYQDLVHAGCEIYLISDRLMHNKFCIVDDKIIMTGSYNWTDNAEGNIENVVITNQSDLVKLYLKNFSGLISYKTSATEFPKIPMENIGLLSLLPESNTLVSQFRSMPENAFLEKDNSDQLENASEINHFSTYSNLQMPSSFCVTVIFEGNEHILRFGERYLSFPQKEFSINFEDNDRVFLGFYISNGFRKSEFICNRTFYKNQFNSINVGIRIQLEENRVRIFSSENGLNEKEYKSIWL
jgi:hypothetical protein